jgi:hypothetical protein
LFINKGEKKNQKSLQDPTHKNKSSNSDIKDTKIIYKKIEIKQSQIWKKNING